MIGRQLAHFRVTDLLGEGGMGAVYRAEDSRLDRDVAIKVLPEAFVADAERLARFEREAKVLASLDHPNIAGIYEVGQAGETHYIAMQLASGRDLSRILQAGPMTVNTAIEVALQIAEGLEAAHEIGVVHRDLKPGNVMVDTEGATGLSVKLLDFGLAKPTAAHGSDPDLTQSPTLTAHMTSAGTILGTAAYMSPEQARGKTVDKRADIWAFGCILYEMLTGKRPFEGGDVTDVLAAVIRAKPDLADLPAKTPRGIRDLIERCLRKDPRRRLRDIGDARTILEDNGDQLELSEPTEETFASRIRPMLPWMLASSLGLVALLQFFSGGQSTASPPPLRRFAIDMPWYSVPNWTDFGVAISPTGTHIAYNGREYNRVDAHVRALDSLEGHPVAEAREAAWMFFSPDGHWLGLMSGTRLSKVPLKGGEPIELADLGAIDTYGYSWGPEGDILIGALGGLHRIPAAGGDIEKVSEVDRERGEQGHLMPSHLPGGQKALITIETDGPPTIGVVDLEDGSVTRLPVRGWHPVYVGSGHLVFRQNSEALAVPFDLESLTVRGDPVPVLSDVEAGPYAARDGTMLYVPTRGEAHSKIVWVTRAGVTTPVTEEARDYSHLDLSNDGRTAVVNIGADVYAYDLERGTRQRLAEASLFPIFTPDDQDATFRQSAFGDVGTGAIVRRPVRGGDELEAVVQGNDAKLAIHGDLRPARSTVPTSWNAKTGDLAFFDNASDIWIRKPDGTTTRFLETEANERTGRFSPDGRWLAYVSDETGEYQVYVAAYPGPGPRVAVSVDGGLSPIWASDMSELLFRRGGKLLSAPITDRQEIRFAAPIELFEGPFTLDFMGHQRWDVAPGGERFLMVENSRDYRLVIVQNWFEELERLAPTER